MHERTTGPAHPPFPQASQLLPGLEAPWPAGFSHVPVLGAAQA